MAEVAVGLQAMLGIDAAIPAMVFTKAAASTPMVRIMAFEATTEGHRQEEMGTLPVVLVEVVERQPMVQDKREEWDVEVEDRFTIVLGITRRIDTFLVERVMQLASGDPPSKIQGLGQPFYVY